MPVDSTAASIWSDADVWVAAALATANPANPSAAFGAGWTMVGLLDGADGFDTSTDTTKNDHWAWGQRLVRTTRKGFKMTKKFSVLEDNITTRALIWPGSTASQIVVPVPTNIKMAWETREGGKVLRYITRAYAQVDVDGSIKDNEDDLTKVSLIATIFPDAGNVLLDRQAAPNVASLALTPLTLALATAGANIKKILATVTYSDATTGDVSASATWSSSDVTKATVLGGYVTAVAAGTASISASYGGVVSTAPCVVTIT